MVERYFKMKLPAFNFWGFLILIFLEWLFINSFNIAWAAEDKPYPKGVPFWRKFLLRSVDFSHIERDFDNLVLQSIQNLNSVTLADMKIKWVNKKG